MTNEEKIKKLRTDYEVYKEFDAFLKKTNKKVRGFFAEKGYHVYEYSQLVDKDTYHFFGKSSEGKKVSVNIEIRELIKCTTDLKLKNKIFSIMQIY